ncbi:MAG: polysaccharide pyruvyl transferase family protein [Chloroflexi bacterium]|nr:polysaccharide pyruvyl transferase family protein [Chloroflexota bacterium]
MKNIRPLFSVMGGSVWGNRGAEAMLMTVCHQIWERDPDTCFNVYSIYPGKDKQLVRDPRINFMSGTAMSVALFHFPLALLARLFSLVKIKLPLPKALSKLRSSMALLDIGGITFSDGRVLQLFYNVLSIWPAMLLGVPVIKLSQALGPFETGINRTISRRLLSKCEIIFSRGQITSSYLDKYFPELHYEEADDIAFLYQNEYSLSNENEGKVTALTERLKELKSEGKSIIGFVPSVLVLKRSLKKGLNYPGVLLNLVLSSINDNVHYVIYPNGTREGASNLMNNDILAIKAIKKYFEAELSPEQLMKIDWVDFDINTRGVRHITQCCSALVTSRYHAMVAGLALCVPTMVIGWSHKYRETLKRFGAERFAIDFQNENLNIQNLYKEFLRERLNIRSSLNSKIEEVKSRSMAQFNYIEKMLESFF